MDSGAYSIACPFCDTENLPGADICISCGQDLIHLEEHIASTELEDVIIRSPVTDLNPPPPISVDVSATVDESIQKMAESKIGVLIITEDDKLAGIFSERDILLRVMGEGLDALKKPIKEFMTAEPETLDTDDTLAFALHKMDVGDYRHVPIVQDGRVLGIVSVRQVLKYMVRHVSK